MWPKEYLTLPLVNLKQGSPTTGPRAGTGPQNKKTKPQKALQLMDGGAAVWSAWSKRMGTTDPKGNSGTRFRSEASPYVRHVPV